MSGIGGGYGMGYGGGGVMVILVLIILFALFGGGFGFGRGRDGYGDGDRHCGVSGCRPAFYDESNYEEEKHLDNKICNSTDKILASEASTRQLIETNYIQDLRDKLAEKNTEVVALKGQIYSDAKFGEVYAKLGHIECELPKRPPVWAECATPVARHIDNGCAPCRGKLDEAFGW